MIFLKNKKIRLVLIVVLGVLILLGVTFWYLNIFSDKNLMIPVEIAGKTLQVDVADTAPERTLGLSGRKTIVGDRNFSLGKELADYGMLFVFEKSEKYGFWMNEMLFSIDMIWLDEEKRVVYIEKNATPESFPKTFTPTVPAKYVLEVVAGFSDKNGLKVGDIASF